MFDSNLLKPINQCPYTGYETLVSDTLVHIFKDNFDRIRVITPCGSCGALLEKEGRGVYIIAGIFTKEEERNKGLAKQLLAVVEHEMKIVTHSGGMTTELGKHLHK